MGRPRSVLSPLRCRQPIGSPRSTTASITDARRRVTTRWSADDDATTVRGPPEATICIGAAIMTVRKTAVLLLNHLALESLVEPSAMLSFQPSFASQPTSPSIAVRPTLSSSSPIAAWLVS